jgi:hypothetical protein
MGEIKKARGMLGGKSERKWKLRSPKRTYDIKMDVRK